MRNIDKLGAGMYRLSTWSLYPLLKQHGLMKCESVLSDDGGQCIINGVSVFVMSKAAAEQAAKEAKRRFVHRVYARCDCGKFIPFGRIAQHKCK